MLLFSLSSYWFIQGSCYMQTYTLITPFPCLLTKFVGCLVYTLILQMEILCYSETKENLYQNSRRQVTGGIFIVSAVRNSYLIKLYTFHISHGFLIINKLETCMLTCCLHTFAKCSYIKPDVLTTYISISVTQFHLTQNSH